ncbi:MAG: endonuclease VIII [Deltaproteobacteria bacterium]|nr:endonuclease VIII [Deltaproteobacteria bacterium]
MPERPDLDYVVPRLREALAGAEIAGARARKPVVLRCAIDEVRGRIEGVSRRSAAVVFHCGARDLVVIPMLAGRFEIDGRDSADLAVAFTLADGRVLQYRDDVQMGKLWWTAPGAAIPGLGEGGIDVLGAAFAVEALSRLARGRREQVKVFLMDKTALDGMGNAYADEVLWAAKLHPKRTTARLSPAEIAALHAAIVEVVGGATATIAARRPALPEKLRDFLHVRGKKGDPCDRCGQAIRTVGIHGHDAYYCPACQPDAEGRGFVDWRRASK